MKEKMKWLSVFYALGDPQVLIWISILFSWQVYQYPVPYLLTNLLIDVTSRPNEHTQSLILVALILMFKQDRFDNSNNPRSLHTLWSTTKKTNEMIYSPFNKHIHFSILVNNRMNFISHCWKQANSQ
jgi:hypothetical protein